MNTKSDGPGKDGPGKDAGRPVESTGGDKKPYATLDLKATEVKSETKAAEAAKDAAAKPAQSSAKPDDKKPTEVKPADVKAADAKTAGKPVDPKAAQGKPDAKADAGRPGKVVEMVPPSPKRAGGSSIGGFFTHLAAGVVGGFLALLGADTIGPKVEKYLPQLGLPPLPHAEAAAKLQARIDDLEKALKQGRGPDLTPKIAATETGLTELRQAQAKLMEETRALTAKLSQGGGEGADARVAKLEQQLATMVAAAETDPKAGRIPQLAQLTGKVSDLETTLNNQLAAMRKSITDQIDQRLTAVAESSEAARSGAQRLDRDVSGLKAEAARVKSDGDRAAATLKVLQEDTASVRSAVDALKAELEAKLRAAAKPDDVSAAIAPVAGKLAALEGNVAAVVKSEDSRKANAERIVLSLELGNLKRAIDRGSAFTVELGDARKAAAGKVDLSALDRFAEKGVATIPDLARELRTLANAIIDADAEQPNANVLDRLLSGAKSVVRVRKVNADASENGVEAVVARMETAIKEDRLGDVLAEAKKLSGRAALPAQDWLTKVEARNTVERAIASVEANLKASLASGTEPAKTEKK